MNTMHLFAGVGGGLLCDLILGHTPVVAVEWDGYACQVLRERAADGWFPGLQVWEGDVRLFDPSEYAGVVDCIHAGFPCQDISIAGGQAGVDPETRSGLYREVLRIAGAVRPNQLFLENVSAIIGNGLGTVLGDLASLGYDCRWLCIRASDVGAPHHRDRWFALCHANSDSCDGGSKQTIQQQRPKEFGGNCSRKVGSVLADSKCSATNEQSGFAMQWGRKIEAEQTWMGGSCEDVADANNSTRCERQRDCAERRQEKHSGTTIPSWWQIESDVGRVANGVPHRVHRLKGLGNAQVPLQAATAYKLLGGR